MNLAALLGGLEHGKTDFDRRLAPPAVVCDRPVLGDRFMQLDKLELPLPHRGRK